MEKRTAVNVVLLVIITFLLLYCTSTSIAGTLSSFPEIFQDQDQWCWAASSESILKYYNESVLQCDMANYSFGQTTCCNNVVWPDGTGTSCNKPNFIFDLFGLIKGAQKMLSHFGGISSTFLPWALSKSTLESEIKAGKPWLMGWKWNSGGGHALVGYGISGDTVHYLDPWPGNGFTTGSYSAVKKSSIHSWVQSLELTTKNIVFAIDDTGSMGGEIADAKAATIKVLDDNKASGKHFHYSLFSFKDGDGILRGQTIDEDTMKNYVNALYASGGAGCPESSLTTIRQAANLAENCDIFMMTDASSNSYGVDDTYASWGEVAYTAYELLKNNCRLHSIVYSDCGSYMSSLSTTASSQNSSNNENNSTHTMSSFSGSSISISDPSGAGGYEWLSRESGGLFFHVPSNYTQNAVEIILKHASSDGTICIYDDELVAGDAPVGYSIPVDPSITSLQIALNADLGSSLSIEVRDPNGLIVNDATPDVTELVVDQNILYNIENAALLSGNWSATISGIGNYRVSATASTTNPMVYSGETSVGLGGSLNLQASFIEDVNNIHFELATIDGTSSIPVSLYDDGAHGDGGANDLFFAGTKIMNQVDSYRFTIIGDNHFQRMSPGKITVGYLDIIGPASKSLLPGASTVITFQIKNHGKSDDTYDLFISHLLDWYDLTGIPSSITVPADSIVNINILVNVPDTALPGQSDKVSLQTVSQNDPLINDTCEVEISIVGESVSLNLVLPIGGEVIPSGGTYGICWEAPSNAVKFDLKYKTDGTNWIPIKTVTGLNCTHWEEIPVVTANKKQCRVKVIGYDSNGVPIGEDISDKPFTIEVVRITSPNGGETLKSGDAATIRWTTHKTIRPVAKTVLKYTTDGSTWNAIKTLTGNLGSFNWKVPAISSTKCKVKVILKDATGANIGTDISDKFFTIQP